MIESILIFLIQEISSAAVDGLSAIAQRVPHMKEAGKNFDEIKKELRTMLAFLEDSENMTERRRIIDEWVNQVREAAYRVEDLIDEFLSLTQSRSGGGIEGRAHNVRHYNEYFRRAKRIADDSRSVRKEIEEISVRRLRYNFPGPSQRPAAGGGSSELHRGLPSFNDGEERLLGQNKEKVVEWLMAEERQCRVVSVWGMGGLGKTTLVRAVYNDPEVKKSFKYRAWTSVSQSCNIDELLRSMARQLQGGTAKGLQLEDRHPIFTRSNSTLVNHIKGLLSEKRYLIVIDDVWSSNDLIDLFDLLPSNMHGSRILVTSRRQNVAFFRGHVLKDLEVEPLPDAEARYLFFKAAFGNTECPQDLEYYGEKIIQMCEGLPLAIVAIGRVMASKARTPLEWRRTYECLEWELRNEETLQDMARKLMLSYHSLPNHLKRCFLYCSLFPEDHTIKTKWLIRLWIAEGFVEEQKGMTMEDVAARYIEQLTERSMLQVLARNQLGRPKACRVHDLMRKLALEASKGEIVVVEDQLPLPDETCRRLSLLKGIDGAHPGTDLSRLRTLLVFTKDPSFSSSLPAIFSSLKFLRVLDLRGAPIKKVPDGVFDLFNLRYLSLRETSVSEIPSDLKRLHKLQTLDLWKTKVTKMPRQILKLRNLRHLYKEDMDDEELKYHNVGHILRGKDAASRIWDLRLLQTLRTIRANKDLVAELGNLTQLRSLGITDLKADQGNALCNSMSRMRNLHRLSIRACRASATDEVMRLDNLSPPPQHLEKLILNGRLEKVPPWFTSLRSLTHLHLFGSQLPQGENPIPDLQGLGNLVQLTLDEACSSSVLVFEAKGFPRLEILYLTHLKELTRLIMKEGAMPKLQAMYLFCLRNLNAAEGIEHLSELQDLYLKQNPRFDPTKVRHVPNVRQL